MTPESPSGEAIIDLDRRDLPGHIPDLARCAPGVRRPERRRRGHGQHRDQERRRASRTSTPTRSSPPSSRARRAGRRRCRAVADLVVRPGDGRRACRRPVPASRRPGSSSTCRPTPSSVLTGRRPPGAASVGRHARRARRSTRCHAAGLAVNTWTCDDPERMRRLVGVGRRRHLHERARHRRSPCVGARVVELRRSRRQHEPDARPARGGTRAGRLAEVVAVDLVRERLVVPDDELVEVGAARRGGRRCDAAAAQRAARATCRIAAARSVRNVTATEPAVERGRRRQVERAVAEVRVRVGVEHDREVAVVDRRPSPDVDARSADGCGRSRAAHVSSAGVDEQRVAEPALQRGAPLDLARRRRRRSRCRCGSRSSAR